MPSNTSLKGASTRTRAIRIAKSLDRILEQEAKKRNISINGLISSILTKFAEWDRYAEDLPLATLPTQM
jgi:predicted HicB family RNase H-like nuclease